MEFTYNINDFRRESKPVKRVKRKELTKEDMKKIDNDIFNFAKENGLVK